MLLKSREHNAFKLIDATGLIWGLGPEMDAFV
jgi:hypothetical protein